MRLFDYCREGDTMSLLCHPLVSTHNYCDIQEVNENLKEGGHTTVFPLSVLHFH